MIERLVFISTMVLLLMVGVNAFLVMGDSLCMPDGSKMNLISDTNSINNCGGYTSPGIGMSNLIGDAQSITPTGTTASSTTTTPGSAGSVINFISGGVSAAYLGVGWLANMLTASLALGVRMAGIFPFLAPIIYIFVSIIAALEGFALMYWTMAGARAFLGRFL